MCSMSAIGGGSRATGAGPAKFVDRRHDSAFVPATTQIVLIGESRHVNSPPRRSQ